MKTKADILIDEIALLRADLRMGKPSGWAAYFSGAAAIVIQIVVGLVTIGGMWVMIDRLRKDHDKLDTRFNSHETNYRIHYLPLNRRDDGAQRDGPN